MKTKTKVIIASGAVLLVFLLIITLLLVFLYMPNNLSELIEVNDIAEIRIENQDLTQKLRSVRMSKSEMEEFKGYIETTLYRKRFFSTQTTDSLNIHITLKNRETIDLDSYHFIHRDVKGKILRQENIYLNVDYSTYYREMENTKA